MTAPDPAPRLAILAGPADGNSTARICARLANGFVAAGTPTDLLLTRTRQPVADGLDDAVATIDLGRLRGPAAVVRLAGYLYHRRPVAVLTQRVRENMLMLQAAALVRRLTGRVTPVFVTVHGPLSFKLAHLSPARRRQRTAQVRRWYPRNRALIAISDETFADLRGASVPVHVIPNPIVTADLPARAADAPTHPWFTARTGPVLVFAGRLVREKDLPTLLRALALLDAVPAPRLLLIGDGPLRANLLAERDRLGLGARVALPGFIANPYPYLRAADLVVLSSVWDALPTVLIEALVLGTPVVSTDCGAAPREILDHGRLGPLVPPGDPAALAAAIRERLTTPTDPALLRAGAGRYDAVGNAERYRRLLLGGGFEATAA